MDQPLAGMNIAILVTDGFEQIEFTDPRHAFEQQGATTTVIAQHRGMVQGLHHDAPGDLFPVDLTFAEADPTQFDGVLVPGGKVNGARIRGISEAQRFLQQMDEDHKTIAAICHAGWLLADAGLADGRTLTSWPSLQEDMRQAGANWVDQEVVVDGNLVTSRKPADLPAFSQKAIAQIEQRVQASARGSRDEGSGIGLSS